MKHCVDCGLKRDPTDRCHVCSTIHACESVGTRPKPGHRVLQETRRKKYLCGPFGLELRDLTPEIIAALVAVLNGGDGES